MTRNTNNETALLSERELKNTLRAILQRALVMRATLLTEPDTPELSIAEEDIEVLRALMKLYGEFFLRDQEAP